MCEHTLRSFAGSLARSRKKTAGVEYSHNLTSNLRPNYHLNRTADAAAHISRHSDDANIYMHAIHPASLLTQLPVHTRAPEQFHRERIRSTFRCSHTHTPTRRPRRRRHRHRHRHHIYTHTHTHTLTHLHTLANISNMVFSTAGTASNRIPYHRLPTPTVFLG